MDWTRSSGILLHPTSLPGPYGIGDFGPAAYAWVDWLAQARQKLWQVLPLGPTGYADSPYASLSSFALNPLLISPQRLVEQGDLEAGDLADTPAFPSGRVDYGAVIAWKRPLLERAARHFLAHAAGDRRTAYDRFCAVHAAWLDEYVLFISLKRHHADVAWTDWPRDVALRRPGALARWQARLAEPIAVHRALQYLAHEQWGVLKAYANARGIQVVGDVPIFCAHDSADVWTNRELFTLDEDGKPLYISGVPPDYFSETGQRWGNPLYRWDVMPWLTKHHPTVMSR